MSLPLPPLASPRRSRGRPRSAGFTLIEALIVVSLIALITTMGIYAFDGVRERATLSEAPKRLMSAMDAARTQAIATGRDTVFILLASSGAGTAALCGKSGDPMIDARCVRYWVLNDVIGATSTRFTDATLTAFDPASPTAAGDTLLDSGYLPTGVYLGKSPAYTTLTIPGTSVFANVPTTPACTFCAATTPARGYVRFSSNAQVQIGSTTARGGMVFLNVVDAAGKPQRETKHVAILQPTGMMTDRLGLR